MKHSVAHWPGLRSRFQKRDYNFTVTDPQSDYNFTVTDPQLWFLARKNKSNLVQPVV